MKPNYRIYNVTASIEKREGSTVWNSARNIMALAADGYSAVGLLTTEVAEEGFYVTSYSITDVTDAILQLVKDYQEEQWAAA